MSTKMEHMNSNPTRTVDAVGNYAEDVTVVRLDGSTTTGRYRSISGTVKVADGTVLTHWNNVDDVTVAEVAR